MKESKTVAEKTFPNSPVPEALSRLLAALRDRVGVGTMDRLWIFPPLVRGRKEWGLVAVSCLTVERSQRTLVTGTYQAEMTGKGMVFQSEFISEGVAPPERLPRVMDGVVRRSDLQLGTPREVEIGGDEDFFHDLLVEYGWKDPPGDPAAG